MNKKQFTDLNVAIELFYPRSSDKTKARRMSKANPVFKKHLIGQAKMQIDNAINIVYANRPNYRSIIKKSIKKHPPAARHIVIYSKSYISPPTSKMRNKYTPNAKRR